MINYLFCLDSNYNNQFLTSLFSIDKNSKKDFNVYVIHKDPETLNTLLKKYKNLFTNLNNIEIHKFDSNYDSFPNLQNNHISEATYYRFFIGDYIDPKVDFLVYLDCDVLCLNNPEQILEQEIIKLKNSSVTISASTEYLKTKETEEVFNRLMLKSNSYFNAGVMIINYDLWVKNNCKDSLLNATELLYEKVNFWDQDILNFVFDEKYNVMSNNLNFPAEINNKEFNRDLRSVIFLHYSGSNKPWTVLGAINSLSKDFHHNYSLVFGEKYMIRSNYKKGAIKDLILSVINLKVFALNYPLEFIKLTIRSVLS